MPAALYPEKKTKTAATRTTVLPDPEQIKAYLLCRTCEDEVQPQRGIRSASLAGGKGTKEKHFSAPR